jgi:uncharacterized membrane protein YphA (DoxX/SURF4 family)
VSDVPQGPGWWQASDGRYYPPQQAPSGPPAAAPHAPQPGPAPYAPQPGPAPYGFDNPQPQNNGKAVAALVCGICAVVFTILCGIFVSFLGLLPGAAAVVLGVIGRNEIRASGGRQQGGGMALAGIITGAIAIALSILLIVLWITLWSSSGGYYD